MSIVAALIRLARQVVMSVIAQLLNQIGIVQDDCLSPMRSMVQEVSGGGTWIGEGANRFVDEVSSMMIPGVGQVCDHIDGVKTNLGKSIDIIDRADQQVTSLANNMRDLFSSIIG